MIAILAIALATAGRYPLAPGFALMVTANSDQLYVQATAQPRFPVYASACDEFFYKVVDAQLTFERDASGNVAAASGSNGHVLNLTSPLAAQVPGNN